MHIAIFIDAGGDDLAAMPLIKSRKIGPAAKKGDAEGGLSDDHFLFSLLPCEELFASADTLPPVIQEVLHGFLIGDIGLPAGVLFELAAIRNLEVGVDGAQAFWVHLHLDLVLFGRHSDEGTEGVADGAGVSAADVVILAGDRIHRHQHIIGSDSIPNIGVGAQRVQIANLHYRGNNAFLDHGDLLGEGGFVEYIAPAGAGVGEHPGGHNGHAISLRIVAAHQIGADFGDSIGGGGMEGTILVDTFLRLHLWGDFSKDLGGGADMDNGFALRNAQGLQKIAGSDDVGVQGVDGRVKAGFGVALGG